MSAELTKDASIWRLLSNLTDQFDAHKFLVIDHWDADLFAIGIARADNPGRIGYISTYRKTPGHYYYECETPHSAEEFEVAVRADEATFEQLVNTIRQHLSMTNEFGGE